MKPEEQRAAQDRAVARYLLLVSAVAGALMVGACTDDSTAYDPGAVPMSIVVER